MISDPERFAQALARFDAVNAEDPRSEEKGGTSHPKELLYAQRMTRWLETFAPDASEALRLAARCQHIRRWAIPRNTYPMDRRGYIQWRRALADYHAEAAGDILRDVGYEEPMIARVQTLLRKEDIKRDPEVQTLEDVICLVFLESYLTDFATTQDEEKLIGILRKTWKKMSPRARETARTLPLAPNLQVLLGRALDTD